MLFWELTEICLSTKMTNWNKTQLKLFRIIKKKQKQITKLSSNIKIKRKYILLK